jgi:ATP-dependent exoDNAse (exonuclease V) beta subunit
MSQLNIYSASAGSGKTYTLAGEFISLLITEPERYASILAVTFTNKATAEMKSRIIENLYILSASEVLLDEKEKKQRAGLMEYHTGKSGKSEKEIQSACKKALTSYLNDFSKFNISTIDSFFQKVIRSFAYEAGLPASFNIEVDQNIILQNAINRLLEKIGNQNGDYQSSKTANGANNDLKRWIMEFINNKMKDGKGWSVEGSLTSFGNEIFREDLQSAGQEFEFSLADKKSLIKYMDELADIISNYKNTVETLSKEIANLINQNGISEKELKNKSRNILVSAFKVYDFFINPDKVVKIYDIINIAKDPSEACNSSLKPEAKNELIAKLQQGIVAKLVELAEFVVANYRNYFTATEIKNNFYSLGISVDLRNTIAELAREEDLFLISDTNRLLNQIIDSNDTPFIYEKSGIRYRNIMIDEFQDTSRLQWNNFKPLIINSLSQNDDCMIVGDVKQSIYRWRNSDWQLLNQTVYSDMEGYGCNAQSLSTNWRSKPNIINFNNLMFKKASEILKNQMNEQLNQFSIDGNFSEDLASQITTAYKDTTQKTPSNQVGHSGYVKIEFVADEKAGEMDDIAETDEPADGDPVFSKLEEAIAQLIANNFKYSDICILVRNNREGSKIATHLLSAATPVPVISNDSLLLGNSMAVRLVIAYLTYINDPADKTALAQIIIMHSMLDGKETPASQQIMDDFLKEWEAKDKRVEDILKLKGMPFFELAQSIVKMLPEWLVEDQMVFINGLLENIRSFTINKTVNINSFIEWWREKGSSTAISVPENQNAVRIMTIHKSKGLQFKAILIPFANWEIDKTRGKQSLIWCSPSREPFNRITPLPVTYSSKLAYTHMSQSYFSEMLYRYVDNLNLLYVAFTRAEDVLMVWCKKDKKMESGKEINILTKISQLIHTANNKLPSETGYSMLKEVSTSETGDIFEAGKMPVLQPDNKTMVLTPNRFLRNNPFDSKLEIHRDSENIAHLSGSEKIWQGKLMHRIMEQIITSNDIGRVLQSFRFSGMITYAEEQELSQLITAKTGRHQEWFDGSHTVYAETSILAPGINYRPDRVMIKDNKAVVVDYKFGQTHSDSYTNQVKKYRQLLRQMGYENVEAYIWYFNEDNGLVNIDSQPQQGTLF